MFTMRMDTLTKQCFEHYSVMVYLNTNYDGQGFEKCKEINAMSGPRQSLIKISFDENLRKQASTQIAVILKLPVWRVIALKWPSWSKIYLLFVILTASSSCHIRGGKIQQIKPDFWRRKKQCKCVKRAKWYTWCSASARGKILLSAVRVFPPLATINKIFWL